MRATTRHLHDNSAHYGITKSGADGQPEVVHQGLCEGAYSNDDDAWGAADAAARAYVNASLPALT